MAILRRLRYRASHSVARVPLIWLRHRGLSPSDILLASYPRSGNTWLRFQLMEVLSGVSAEFDTINRYIPEMGIQVKARPLLPSGGRLIKTHEPYRREYRRAVYIHRDVRDVLFSAYSRVKQLQLIDIDLDTYIAKALLGQHGAIGSWQDHISSWLESSLAKSGDLLIIRFEDLRYRTEETLCSIVDFLGLPPDRKVIQRSILNNNLSRMREKENRSRNLPKSTQEQGRFVRQGAVSGWQARFSHQQLRMVDQYAGEALRRLGYTLGSSLINAGETEVSAVDSAR